MALQEFANQFKLLLFHGLAN